MTISGPCNDRQDADSVVTGNVGPIFGFPGNSRLDSRLGLNRLNLESQLMRLGIQDGKGTQKGWRISVRGSWRLEAQSDEGLREPEYRLALPAHDMICLCVPAAAWPYMGRARTREVATDNVS